MAARFATAPEHALAAVAVCLGAALGCTPPSAPPLPPPGTAAGAEAAATVEHPLPAELPEPAEPPTSHQRYWLPMLALDIASIYPAVSYVTAPSSRPWLIAAPVLSGPLVHLFALEPRRAALSFGLRALVAGGGLLLARTQHATECKDRGLCMPWRTILLLDLALVLPMALDEVWLAVRRVPVEAPRPLPVMPSVAVVPGGATFGVSFGL